MNKKLPNVYLKSELIIGDLKLDCFVLDENNKNPSRILSAKAIFNAFDRPRKGMNSRLEIDGEKLPPFIAAGNLKPLINQEILELVKPLNFLDGTQEKSGYRAELLPVLCSLYLKARRTNILLSSQKKIADKAEILQEGFSRVGIIALIDEATGFQNNRKYDALRILLETYLNDKIKAWTKKFPDDFFFQLDRLYGNESLNAFRRPQHYGKFINTYIYEPLEKGRVNNELHKRYLDDKKRHRKHQHFTEFGDEQLRFQIGRIHGLLEVAPHLRWFKEKQERQGQLVLFPDLE